MGCCGIGAGVGVGVGMGGCSGGCIGGGRESPSEGNGGKAGVGNICSVFDKEGPAGLCCQNWHKN